MAERAVSKKKSAPEVIAPTEPCNRQEWAARINGNWRKAVTSIIDTGRDLIASKRSLDADEYAAMIATDLDFKRPTAVKLVEIANDDRLCSHVNRLPPRFTTLYALTMVEDDVFAEAIANGDIHPDMLRKDVAALLSPKEKKAVPAKATPESTTKSSEVEQEDEMPSGVYHSDKTLRAIAEGTYAERVARRVLDLNRAQLKEIDDHITKLVGPGPAVERV
jgi:hypothetical protein